MPGSRNVRARRLDERRAASMARRSLPTVHHRPPCLGDLSGGWHDIAATITHRGVHHVWQGCLGAKTKPGGWAHSHSSDLVSWTFSDISPSDAGTSPLAGFVQLDDSGVPCAGFNQRHVPGHPMPWNTPLGLVCAKNAALTEWGEPEILFPVNFWEGFATTQSRPGGTRTAAGMPPSPSTPATPLGTPRGARRPPGSHSLMAASGLRAASLTSGPRQRCTDRRRTGRILRSRCSCPTWTCSRRPGTRTNLSRLISSVVSPAIHGAGGRVC